MSKRGQRERQPLDLYRLVLDHTLVDADGLQCGVVDDIEAEGKPGEPLAIVALLVGPGAWAPRLPAFFAIVSRLFAGTRLVRVPWSEVAGIDEQITLRSAATKLGLGVADRRAGRWLKPLPMSGYAPK